MKVAYICHRFPHLTEIFVTREMYWIREQGIDVSIFSLMPSKDSVVHERSRELLPLVHYSPLFSGSVFMAQLYFLGRTPGRYLRALWKTIWQTYREPTVMLLMLALFPKTVFFARHMEKLGVEHIHVHFAWLAGISASAIAELLGVSFSLRPHAFDIFSRDRRDTRVQLENASKVITISQYNRNYIADLCPRLEPGDIEVVYCGMETNTMQPAPPRAANSPLRILSIGRPAEKKGLEYLIDACALLVERGIPFHCDMVVGKWSQYKFWQRRKTDLQQRGEALKAQIKRLGLEERVTLLGDQDQQGILQLYHRSDIFALPCVVARSGDRDGIPGVLQEAMACTLPVVTTPVTGIPELVINGETGLLVPERDAKALADALELLIADPGLRHKLGQQARVKVLQDYEIRHNMAQLAAILQKLGTQTKPQVVAQPERAKKVTS